MPLLDDLKLHQQYRDNNPQLSDLSDTQLTDLVNSQTGELQTLKDSSGIARVLGKLDLGLHNAGQSAEQYIAPEGSGFGQRVAGRAAANLISGAPEIAMNMAAARVLPQSKVGAGLIAGLNAVEQYGRTSAETGDRTASLGAAGSALASLGGSVLGSRVGLGSEGRALEELGLPQTVRGRVGQALGSYVGGIPGQVLGIATQPGGLKEFANDPVNIPAQLLSDVANVGIGEALHAGNKAKTSVEDVKANTPSLDEFAPRTMDQEYTQLLKKPVSQMTEPEVARKAQIEDQYKQQDAEKTKKAFEQQLDFPFAETKDYSVNEDRAKKKYPNYIGPYKYIGFQEAPPGHSLYPGFELWNDQNNSTLARPSIEGTNPGLLPPEIPHNPDTDFSINHEMAKQSFIENNLLDNIEKSFQPTLRSGGRVTGARFQRDPNGLVGSKGMRKAIEQWAPREFYDHYKQSGLDTLLASDKVQPEQVVKWIRENTPQIEVKKLTPSEASPATSQRASIQHELETSGWKTDNSGRIMKQGADLDYGHDNPNVPDKIKELASQYRDLTPIAFKELETDAATGRYGVEPISVDKMDRPVDILVREPIQKLTPDDIKAQDKRSFKLGTGTASEQDKHDFLNTSRKSQEKFKGPHFGDSDKNVIASVRGYFPDPDTFLAFEVQSDWAQAKAKAGEEVAPRLGTRSVRADVANTPVLSSYETIALKTAIQHALDNGATHIVIPDGKTVSMIEGHDKYAKFTKKFNTNEEAQAALAKYRSLYPDAAMGIRNETTIFFDPSYSDKVPERIAKEFDAPEPTQLGGMKQHYDRNLPDIMRKLTRDKGERVSLGDMDREASAAFGGKKDITGLKFQLGNLHPDVEKMFSVYGAAKQYDYTKQLFKLSDQLEHEIINSPNVSDEQFINATLDGRNIDKSIALNYIKGLAGHNGLLKIFKDKGEILGFADRTGQIAVNIEDGKRAFRTLSHEASHVALEEMKRTNPAAHKDWTSFVMSMDGMTWQGMLEQLHKAVGLEGQDAQYLSGNSFSERDPRYVDKVVKERTAGLAEVLAHNAYENNIKINETVSKYLNWLPMSFQSWLTRMASQWRKFVGPQTPSLRHYLDDENSAYLGKAFDKLIEFTRKSQSDQAEAYKQLKQTGLFDESEFVDKLPNRRDMNQWQPAIRRLSALADPEARDYALSWLKDSGIATKKPNAWEDNFESGLFRTKLIPETKGFFNELHHFPSKIREKAIGYLGFIGQDDKNSKSYQQALESSQNRIDHITSQPGLLLKMSKIISENMSRRDEALNPTDPNKQPVPFVTEDMLVQPKEMVEKFGLSEDEAQTLQRLIKIPALVAQQTLRTMEAADTVNTAKLLYLQNKKQDIQSVKDRTAQLTRIASQQGETVFQRKYLQGQLEQKFKTYGDSANPEEVQQFQQQIGLLQQQEAKTKMLFEAETRRLFGQDVGFSPVVGKDPFIDQLHSLTSRLAESRAEQAFIMKDEGYAPMTRRGRFLLRVFEQPDDGKSVPKTLEFKGFNTKSEAESYVKDKAYDPRQVELMDKEDFAARAKLYSPKQLQAVRDRAKSDLSSFLDNYSRSVSDIDPNKQATMKVISDVMSQYKPLDQELREVISVKGDKFAQRKWKVAGFNESDFIPNILEYASYKTASGQKTLTRAEAELQMLQPRVQDDPALNGRMQKELDYVLNRTNEWSGARKAVFYTYLAASTRHMLQNTMQLPLNAIPEMVHQGAGFHAYSHLFNASKLFGKYLATGSTGNKTFDILLKQAEKEGITIPNAVEMVAPETDVMQSALDHASAWANGKMDIGGKLKLEALKFMRASESFMRSTSVASEMSNRKISFIMSLLESERKGVKDPRVMYNSANQFTDYSNFVGDKANRPGYQIKLGDSPAHAPVLLATAMQSFVINHLSQLYAYNKLAWKGDKNARAALATGVFHLLAAAGVMGLPFASNAEQMFESATKISLRTAMREKLIRMMDMFGVGEDTSGRFADSVLDGFPNFVGVDTGSSLGLGDPFFQWRAGQDTSALDLIGPAGGLASKVGRGVKALTADPSDPNQWFAATRAVAPQALSQTIKIMDAISDGDYKDSRGNPVVRGLDGQASMATLAGFTPRQVSKVQDLNSLRITNEKRLSDKYKEAVNTTANSLAEFEKTGDQNALLRANDQFTKFVQSRAGTQDRASLVSSISQVVSEKLRGGQKPTTLTEQNSFGAIQKAYPDVEYHFSEQLPAAVDELKTAQLLGQPDVLMQKVRSFPAAVPTKVLYDRLVQAGIPPPTAQLIAERSMSGVKRLAESQTGPFQSTGDGQ